MDTDHVRLYVAMSEMFQDLTEIVTTFSEFVADKCPFRVISRLFSTALRMSAFLRIRSALPLRADLADGTH